MNGNAKIVREFIESWSGLDAARLADYFHENGVYHNMPMDPVVGRDNIRVFIEAFLETWTETQWEVLNLVVDGRLVIAERIDKTKSSAGNVDLPCVGVFEMADGKIKVWRDYFDMATYTDAMQS